jgi:hypothetical protein
MADVMLFENAGFKGKSVTLSAGEHRLDNFNDIASSIRVPAGMVALVFEHAGPSGGYGLRADFLEDCADLSAYYLNDKISYVSVFPTKQPSGLVWVRAQLVNDDYVPGHWERQRAAGGPTNPSTPTISPPVLPRILEISQASGKPWVNPPFDTSNPNWSGNVVGGKTFDGSSHRALEWVSVLGPPVEQDDQVGLAGTVIDPDLSGNDLPFTHPFGNDFEFTIVPDAAYTSLLAAANRDPNGVYKSSWPSAHLLGIDPPGVLGLEVDAAIVPQADRCKHADRVATYGRWIVDAGHPEFHTEIHPPLLMAHGRCVDALGRPAPPTEIAITHVQFWIRPYQSGQRFTTNGDTGLCLQDYVKRIVETLGSITAWPPIFPKPFAGVHLVAFTVRPPLPQRTAPGPAGGVSAPLQQLECSYHFTVNGSCGVEVITSPADPNAVLVLFALSAAGCPKLPDPPHQMKPFSISALMDEAKKLGADVAWYEDLFIKLKGLQLSDTVGFRIFNAPATSALDSVSVVPFTPLHALPASVQVTDSKQPFPVRGWVKLAWVPAQATTGGGGNVTTVFELAGNWASGGQPGPKISRSGNALTVDMSAYRRPAAHGSIIDAQTITVTFADDTTFTARLLPPGTIAWSNNTRWTKV